jgi:hypothetical protein
MLETGKFVEVKPVEPVKQDTKWEVVQHGEKAPIIHALCPNCKSDLIASGERAPYQKLFHVCFGSPEPCPYELGREYFDRFAAWKKAEERRPKTIQVRSATGRI